MKKSKLVFSYFVICIAFLAGCASKGPVPGADELTIRLITPREATSRFSAEGAPNPFTARILVLTTLPNYFLTAAIHVPKAVGQVDILDMTVFSEDGNQIAEAASKEEMLEYWDTTTGDVTDKTRQMEAIGRFYLPGRSLSGKLLGKDYVVVFLSKDKYKPTDRVEVRFLVDGEVAVFTLDASTVVSEKKKW